MYEEYVSFLVLLRFFLSPTVVVFLPASFFSAGALPAGAFPAVEGFFSAAFGGMFASAGEGAGAGGNAGGAGEFGNVDPELEMALRISLEEQKEAERKRQEDEKKKSESTDKLVEEPKQSQQGQGTAQPPKEENLDDLDEEELMKRAQEMSLHDEPKKDEKAEKTDSAIMQDPSFVEDLLKSVGLDPNNPDLKKDLENQKGEKKEEDKK